MLDDTAASSIPTSMSTSRFVIQRLPKRSSIDTISMITLVVNSIIDDYKLFHDEDGTPTNFDFELHDDIMTVSMLSTIDEQISDTIVLLGGATLGSVLDDINRTVYNDLYNMLISKCNVNKFKLLERCFMVSKGDGMFDSFTIPKWILVLVSEQMNNLLDLPMIDMLTITDTMIINGINDVFKNGLQ